MGALPKPETTLYETDFLLWSEEQARLLQAGRLADIDLANLIEEVESLGGAQKSAVDSQLARLIMHLLKWTHQSSHRSRSWKSSIIDARRELRVLFKRSPSVRRYAAQEFTDSYSHARKDAARETDLPLRTFPEAPPFTIEQVLDDDFWPE